MTHLQSDAPRGRGANGNTSRLQREVRGSIPLASIADLPPTVERLLAATPGGLPDAALPSGCAPERVGLVLLDAFGRRFLERHGDHPLVRRIESDGVLTPLVAQFPSTTTAHVTTMHTGLPVGEHGLYEWRVLEPELGTVIVPLRFSLPDEAETDTLYAHGLDPRALLAPGTLYERLAAAGIESAVIQPAAFSPSTFDGIATAGARLRPYDGFAHGVEMLCEELARPGRGYAYLYWDRIDALGHMEGPDSPAFEGASRHALRTLNAALRNIPGALVLITADHGQVAVSPDRVDYLDDVWPPLCDLLAQLPAGSSRDCFLHVVPGAAARVVSALQERLSDRGEALLVSDMIEAGAFGAAGPRLRARLGDVCVLPAAGRQAWVRAAASVERRFRGQHGGLHPDEVDTWVGALPLYS
jgi:hypothetical protein